MGASRIKRTLSLATTSAIFSLAIAGCGKMTPTPTPDSLDGQLITLSSDENTLAKDGFRFKVARTPRGNNLVKIEVSWDIAYRHSKLFETPVENLDIEIQDLDNYATHAEAAVSKYGNDMTGTGSTETRLKAQVARDTAKDLKEQKTLLADDGAPSSEILNYHFDQFITERDSLETRRLHLADELGLQLTFSPFPDGSVTASYDEIKLKQSFSDAVARSGNLATTQMRYLKELDAGIEEYETFLAKYQKFPYRFITQDQADKIQNPATRSKLTNTMKKFLELKTLIRDEVKKARVQIEKGALN